MRPGNCMACARCITLPAKNQPKKPRKFNLLTGVVKNYYEDGKLLSECLYRGSRQHGLYTSYYANGKMKEQGEYVANKKHKEWKEFDEEGNVIKTYVFRAGILIEEK